MGGSYSTSAKGGSVTVNAYSEKWLRQGFPWVYPAELASPRPRAGSVVRLRSAGGDVLGTAIADDGWIAARRFRADDGPIDAELLTTRLEAALRLRRRVLPPRTTAWRLVNAENDELPGIRVDIWGEHAVISLDAPSLLTILDPLADAVEHVMGGLRSVHLAWRPDPRDQVDLDATGPDGRRLSRMAAPIRGTPEEDVVVEERGVRFVVRPGAGAAVGLYPDMRDNRAWLEPFWAGRELLNLFAFTGAFSVAAARAGAETVSVDLAQPALDRAAANFRANDLPVPTLLAEDSFKVLDRFRRQGRSFDVVLLDPPGHSHSAEGTWSGEKDYSRLVAAALRVTKPGGWLVAASNLGSVSPHRFQGMLLDGARRADRPLRLLFDGGQAPDFPAALHFPEGRYLKFVVCAAD